VEFEYSPADLFGQHGDFIRFTIHVHTLGTLMVRRSRLAIRKNGHRRHQSRFIAMVGGRIKLVNSLYTKYSSS
jgi:hypothetical protein